MAMVEGKIIGRGVSDHKGSFVSRLQAIEALLAQGPLPVTVKFLLEGDEEVGSPDLWDIVTRNKDLLRADACLYPGWYKDEQERPMMNAGSRGSMVVELVARGANRNLHGRHAPLTPNPLWRLNRLFSTLVDERDEVLIEGFYDDVEIPTEADIEALVRIPFDGELVRRDWNISSFVAGVDGLEALKRLVFHPVCSLRAVTTDGSPTQAVPSVGRALLSFAMVPKQRPEDILQKLKVHVKAKGFEDLEVIGKRVIGRPARVPMTERIVLVVTEAARAVYDREPIVMPLSSGSGPRYVFIEGLGAPIVADAGVSYSGSNDHAVNENIRVKDYLEGVLHAAEIIRRF